MGSTVLEQAVGPLTDKLLRRTPKVVFRLPAGSDIGELLGLVYQADPRLILCVESVTWTSYQHESGQKIEMEITYRELMASQVLKLRDEKEFGAILYRAAHLGRRRLAVVFPESCLERVKTWLGGLHEQGDFLNCFFRQVVHTDYKSEDSGYAAMDLKISYACTQEWQQKRLSEMETEAKRLAAYCRKAGKEDWQRLYALLDYGVRHWTYNQEPRVPSAQYTAYGALMDHKAVCMGFALAMCLVCRELGIPCRYVTGQRNGGHAWNLVYAKGGWFYLDLSDAICMRDPLHRWGMTVLSDRTPDHPCTVKLRCHCDADYVRARLRPGKTRKAAR